MNGAGDVMRQTSTENNVDEECIDDKQLVRNTTLIVRLPTQVPNAQPSNVIVIDDSDDETATSTDVKPNVRQLDSQLVEPAMTASDVKPPLTTMVTDQTNHIEHEPTASTSAPAEQSCQMSAQKADDAGSGGAQAGSSSDRDAETVQPPMPPTDLGSGPSSKLQRQSSKSTPRATRAQNMEAVDKSSGKRLATAARLLQTEVAMQDVSVQTETPNNSAVQLESLRNNVLQLLKTIVPTLSCSNLEFVDELVVEMVRVNAGSCEIDD